MESKRKYNSQNNFENKDYIWRTDLKTDWKNFFFRYADDTTLMAESEELKSLLMRVKEETEKVGLTFSIQKPKIMAYHPITLWQIDRETMERVSERLYFLGLQNHCWWWVQPWN